MISPQSLQVIFTLVSILLLGSYNGRTREGNGTPLQYSCLENPMDGGAWWAAVHGVTKSWTRLSDFTFTFHFHALEKEMATHSCSCLENPRDGGAWWAVIYGVAQSRTRLKWLSSSSNGRTISSNFQGQLWDLSICRFQHPQWFL